MFGTAPNVMTEVDVDKAYPRSIGYRSVVRNVTRSMVLVPVTVMDTRPVKNECMVTDAVEIDAADTKASSTAWRRQLAETLSPWMK
jgi:hypothetical protein